MTETSNKKPTICVYCGASPRVPSDYIGLAGSLGRKLAETGWRVVYGGGQTGLMGAVANGALEAGGEVIGIIPGHIDEREIRHEHLTELHVVSSMHERKQMMASLSHAFIIMPGGLGTMDEFFEILTWRQLGLHNKPIYILNYQDYWLHLLELMNHMTENHFMKRENQNLFEVKDTIKKLCDSIENDMHYKGHFKESFV